MQNILQVLKFIDNCAGKNNDDNNITTYSFSIYNKVIQWIFIHKSIILYTILEQWDQLYFLPLTPMWISNHSKQSGNWRSSGQATTLLSKTVSKYNNSASHWNVNLIFTTKGIFCMTEWIGCPSQTKRLQYSGCFVLSFLSFLLILRTQWQSFKQTVGLVLHPTN